MDTLETLNKFIKAEHGNPVTADSVWRDSGTDSFGTTMVFCDMDEKYGCFDKEWLKTVDFTTLTVQEVLDRVSNASTEL